MSDEYNEELLDSPLVVHKESDASYQETASEMNMNSTHCEEEEESLPTLERHRFRKKKKSKKPLVFIAFIVAVAVAVVLALNYSGVLNKPADDNTTTTKRSYTTSVENKFEGVITVKGSYIFFEGEEVDGINSLERKIKYLPEGTKFVIQDEGADSHLLNDQDGILSTLSKYQITYDITHIVSSGLKSKYETTTAPSTKKTTKSKSVSKSSTSSTKQKEE